MKVKHKKTGEIGSASRFCTSSPACEIIVHYADDMDSAFAEEFDVQLSDGVWYDFISSLRCRNIVSDNHDVNFREAQNLEERKRGYYY